jgi:hypothetical protein
MFSHWTILNDYLHRIYPNYLEGKDTIDTQNGASYLDLHLEIENGWLLKTNLYDSTRWYHFSYRQIPIYQ